MIKRKPFIDFGATNDTSIDYIIGILTDARITTLEKIQGISEEELQWQYAKGWNSIGALLLHLWALENYFSIMFMDERKLTQEELIKYGPALKMGKYLPQLITNQPVEFYIKKLANSREVFLKKISQLSITEFHRKRAGYDPENGCNLAWVLYHLAEDEVHHRGQITIIRKLYLHLNK